MQQGQLFQSNGLIAGVDEAGRGPLAGPVVAAAVILDAGRPISGLDDSKKLSPAIRESLSAKIKGSALSWAVAWADAAEIDALNILEATMLAMRRAVIGLSVIPDGIQVDGNRLPDVRVIGKRVRGEAFVKGDSTHASIAAASILAKTSRDRIMIEIDRLYPGYGFARHKGYGTEVHREQLIRQGPCDQHRRSFAPVRLAG